MFLIFKRLQAPGELDGPLLFNGKALAALIFPLVAEQFLAIAIGMADTVMVSGVSESAVSAISLVDTVNILLIQLFSAMSTGGAVVAAQYIGKGEPHNACAAAKQLMYVSLFISLGIMAATLAFCRPILRLCFGALSESTMAYCETYFLLSAVSYPFLALYNGGAALLRAMGNSKASLFTSIVMNIINVGGNALLIYGLRMEVAGAATASLVARAIGALVMVKLLLDQHSLIHLERPLHPELNRSMVGRIFRLGIPNGLENSMFQIGKLLVAGILAVFTESVIAANAVAGNIATMVNLPGIAIGLGMVTVVGQCIGAGNIRQARYYTRLLLAIVYALMLVTTTVLFFFCEPVVRIFNLSQEGVDAAVEVLRFYAISAAILWPASFTVPNALRAAGDARFTMIVAVLSMWIFRIAFSYVLCFGLNMGLMGVWVAMVIDWLARAIAFVWRYRGEKWLQKKVV